MAYKNNNTTIRTRCRDKKYKIKLTECTNSNKDKFQNTNKKLKTNEQESLWTNWKKVTFLDNLIPEEIFFMPNVFSIWANHNIYYRQKKNKAVQVKIENFIETAKCHEKDFFILQKGFTIALVRALQEFFLYQSFDSGTTGISSSDAQHIMRILDSYLQNTFIEHIKTYYQPESDNEFLFNKESSGLVKTKYSGYILFEKYKSFSVTYFPTFEEAIKTAWCNIYNLQWYSTEVHDIFTIDENTAHNCKKDKWEWMVDPDYKIAYGEFINPHSVLNSNCNRLNENYIISIVPEEEGVI